MTKLRVGVAHPGTQHSWQTALAFQEASQLRWYATSYYYKESTWPDRTATLLPGALRVRAERELRRRQFDALDDRLVRRAFETEFIERPIGTYLSRNLSLKLQHDRHRRFPARLLRIFEREPVDVLWGPHDCLEAFEALKPRGVFCVLDQPIGHFASLDRTMRDEHRRHPDFFYDNQVGVSAEDLDRQRRAAEIADLIVVGSTFAERTLIENGVAAAKVRIVPYGYDEQRFPREEPNRPAIANRPIEFLFVGSVGPRKGVAYLLEAFQQVDPAKARLTLVGPLGIPTATFARYSGNVNYLGQVTRDEIPSVMSGADCFVFPSLFEGGGIVLYEAAATALGIIQTAACGDGVRDARNGLIVKSQSTQAIFNAVERATEKDVLQPWRDASWDMRGERTWAHYRSHVAKLLAPVLTAEPLAIRPN